MEMYKNASISVEKRVDDLLSRMSVTEKVGQLNQRLCGFQAFERIQKEDGSVDFELNDYFKKEVDRYGIGVLYGLFRADPWSKKTYADGITAKDAARMYNKVQHYVIEHSRLGIPMLMSIENPHGLQALDGYIIPVNLASGCTFHPELLRKAFAVTRKQQKAMGVHLSLMSALDMARDPRWGRSEECYSEDPYLSARMAVAAMQGNQYDENGNLDLITVVKHFAAQGQCTGGINASPASIGERELREIHLPVMKQLAKSGCECLMAAYNEIDGIPCHANKWLLNDVLRKEMGFKGAVMADGCAIDRLNGTLASDAAGAGAVALKAGVDISLWDNCFSELEEAFHRGDISVADLDRAVRHVLTFKFQLGLFDHPYVEEKDLMEYNDYDLHPESLALSRESVVLLKNNGILPLDASKYQKIAVIGPNADHIYNQMGDYTPPMRENVGVTLLQGIKEQFSGEVTYVHGCKVCTFELDEIERAADAAKEADLTILALGGSSNRNFDVEFDTNGAVIVKDAILDMDCGEGVDVANVALGGYQQKLADAVFAAGKPVVTVVIAGRAYAMGSVTEPADAALCAFYGGPMSGRAIAEILFGKVNPSGRLSVSIPRSSGQLPVFYNQKDLGTELKYHDSTRKAQYPFGFGLSYQPMEYAGFRPEQESLTLAQLSAGARSVIRFRVKNAGTSADYALPMLYIKDLQASITRRVKELKDFTKVLLQPGEEKELTLSVGEEELSVWDSRMKFTPEPGDVQLILQNSDEVLFETTMHILP